MSASSAPLDAAALEQHRATLTGHCYRMLGSLVDADDAVQETMVRAWRSLERFDRRSSLRTWMTKIATNVCFDALADRSRRARPMDEGPAGALGDPLEARPRTHWLEPIPDARVLPDDASPAERAVLRQSIRLAFVAALQHLPASQRAALLLTEVLGWSAAEVADSLDTTVAAVNSQLQRARAKLASRDLGEPGAELSDEQTALVGRYVEAFERYDLDELAALLHRDAAMSMPPFSLWLRGPDAIAAFLAGPGAHCRDSRMVPIAACGSPAFAQYHAVPGGGRAPWAIVVLELRGDRIAEMTFFLDTETLFPLFGLPTQLPD
jgi:RNA polymerase sigma-70 factor, ECF subfamily